MRERAVAGAGLAVLFTAGLAFAEAAPLPGSPAPEKLTLADAVARAVAQNPSVALATSQIERAGALVQQARAGWLPTLSGNALLNHLDADRVFSDRVVAASNQMTGNLLLTVPLVSAPAWAATRRARSGERIAEASAADVRRQVAQATARAYLLVVAQHRLVAAEETARDTAKAHYEFARARLAGGVGHSIDEVRAQQDLATIEIQLQADLVALTRTREALGVLLAAPGPIDASDDVTLGKLPSMAEAMESVRATRTDLRLLDVRLKSSKNAADDVWSYYMPYLAAIGQPFVQHPPTLLQPTTGWQAQLVLTLPIYDGGLRGGITRERNAALADARTNLDAGLAPGAGRAPHRLRNHAARRLRPGGGARGVSPGASRLRPGHDRLSRRSDVEPGGHRRRAPCPRRGYGDGASRRRLPPGATGPARRQRALSLAAAD